MTLLAPAALALIVFAVPIILMYVLKLRRPEKAVSSTLLWRRALDDLQANAPWQRLRPNLLLLLQLLALLALVVTLARPAYSETKRFTGDLVIIVDQSPTMQATDVAPSRFDVALRQARHFASDLGTGSVMSVMGMGSQPHLVVAESDDHGAINRGIDRLHPGVTPPNFLAALSLATSLARNGEKTRVVVLTSRDSGIRGPPAPVPFSLEIVRLGGQLRDLGVTAFHAARIPGRTQAALSVRNFGSRTVSSDLDLYADGQLADVRPLTLGPHERRTIFWTQLPGDIDRLQARLALSDDMALDKSARVVLPPNTVRRILLVTSGNYWLQAAVALDPTFKVSSIAPDIYAPGVATHVDLVVFDGVLPDKLPATATLLVDPPAGRLGPLRFGRMLRGGTASPTSISRLGPLSSLLQYVDLSDVHVAQFRQVRLPSWMESPITSGGRPLLAVGAGTWDRQSVRTGRLAVITFDLHNSDWPLRISYPIVMHNLLEYLAPELTLSGVNLDAGRPLRLYAGPGVREIDITRPDGTVDRLHPPYAPFTDTATPGFYTVQESGSRQRRTATFAANVLSARGAPAPGPRTLRFGSSHTGTAHGIRTHTSFAWLLALASLGLLTVEWWFAWRR